jgi:hypothetical protein
MTIADYLWNPIAYDCDKSLENAQREILGDRAELFKYIADHLCVSCVSRHGSELMSDILSHLSFLMATGEKKKAISEFKEYELIFSSIGGQVVNEMKFGLPGLEFNLWKSSSPDFMGPWANVAGAALAKNGAMFTAAAEQIEGSIQGTGELTKHITITASAKLVRSFSFGDLLPVGKNIALLKCEDAKPGDTLILAPNISLVRPVPLDSSADGECVACWYYAPSQSEHSTPVYLKDAPLITWDAYAVRGRIQA